MSDNLAYVLTIFIFWGWIPVLSIGKAVSWIIESAKSNNDDDTEDDMYEEETKTRSTCSGDNPRPARD